MIVGGLQKLTLIDYPGKLACTVFCLGCNYRCPFCYNPELVLAGYISPKSKVFQRTFFNFLKERQGFLEGVVLCGGEPTIYQDLPEFCKKIKDLGYLVKLDTNGSNPELLKQLIDNNLIDYIAMDIKAPREKYLDVIGVRGQLISGIGQSQFWAQKIIENIDKSIDILKQGKVDYEFRTTMVPKFLTKKDILEIVHWIKPAKSYFLQNFQQKRTLNPEFKNLKPYSSKYLLAAQKAVAPFFETCQIRE